MTEVAQKDCSARVPTSVSGSTCPRAPLGVILSNIVIGRSAGVITPGSTAASASARVRALYSAVKLLLRGRGSGVALGSDFMFAVFDMGGSSVALLSSSRRGRCLTHVDMQGTAAEPSIHPSIHPSIRPAGQPRPAPAHYSAARGGFGARGMSHTFAEQSPDTASATGRVHAASPRRVLNTLVTGS